MAEWTKRFSLAGKTALVTGASKGIGFEACRVLSDAGADIVAVGRDAEGLAAAAEAVAANGRTCLAVEADLATVDGPVAAAEEALERFGTIDILVNNAGTTVVEPLTEAKVEDFDFIIAVNLRAPFLLAKTLAPAMIAQRAGKIVNVSSQTGVVGLVDHAAYAASKGGLNGLTKAIMTELAPHNIQVNAICPTVILTPMGDKVWGDPAKADPMRARIPLGRFGRPVEVADCILYLASPASDMLNGDIIMIDGGFTSA